MKNQEVDWFIAFLVVLTFLGFAVSASAALPFTIKPGHPRVYLDSTRVNVLRTEIQQDQAFNGQSFPQAAGTLTFDLFVPPPPSSPTLWPQTVAGFWPNSGIFDDWDITRNHIYLSHFDRNDAGPYYPCGVNNTEQAAIRIAFQQQSSDAGSSRFYSPTPCVLTNTWVTVTVYWDTSIPVLGYTVVGGCLSGSECSGSTSAIPAGWTPNGQRFRFTGRSGYNAVTGENDIADRLDNIRLYSSATASPSNLILSYPLNEGEGVYAADDSGNGHPGRLASEVKWVKRSASDPNPAIEINNSSYPFSAIAESPVVDAWPGFRKLADQYANIFNNCSGPIDYHPENDSFTYYDPVAGTTKVCPLSGNPATGHEGIPRSYARILGLAWLITPDPKFSSAAMKYADLLIDIPADIGDDLVRAARVEAMGLLYDYLYDVPAMRDKHALFVQKIKETVARYDLNGTTPSSVNAAICGPGYYFTLGDTICRGWYPLYPDQTGPRLTIGNGHNHSVNAALSAGIFGLLDAPDAELESVLYMTHLNFVSGFNPARAWIAVDGGFHMGWGYSATYNDLSYILAWNTATNLNMTADWQGKLTYMYLYALRGDLVYPSGGDGSGGADLETIKPFAWWASLNAADGYAQRFYRRWLMPTFSQPFFDLVLGRSGLPESAIEDLPYSRLFRNAGRVLMRDSWDYPNATLMEFKSTSFYHLGHDHMDQNSFSIFYKSPLLVDSGFYDVYNNPHWHNYYIRSIAHNLVTVWDPTECFEPTFPTGYGCASNDGGQKHFKEAQSSLADIQQGGSNHLDGVTAYEYTPDYTYTAGNASKAYKDTKLDQAYGFIRSLLYLRTPSFWNKPVTVVFDKVTAKAAAAGLTKRFLLHSVNEPVASVGESGAGPTPGTSMPGNTVVIQNGGGMLFSQTLLPTNPVITKIGGKDAVNDFRFRVPSKTATDYQAGMVNYPPNPDPDASATDSYISADMGNWRLEVMTQTPAQREYFLHVLSVADNGSVSAPPQAQNLSSSTTAVALLADTQTIAFSKSDTPATTLSWDSPIANTNMIVAGLAPNTSFNGKVVHDPARNPAYTVKLDSTGGTLMSSAQGVLAIKTPLPLQYTLTVTKTGTGTGAVSGSPGITCGADCSEAYDTGTAVTLTASPAGDSEFLVWTNCPGATGNTCPLTTNASRTVNAEFRLKRTDLSILMTDGPDPVNTGATLTYTVTVTNSGPSNATGVITTHTLPTGVSGSATPSQGSCSGTNPITCTLGNLNSGQGTGVTISAIPGAEVLFDATASSVFSVSATASSSVTGGQADPNSGNNSATTSTTVRLACLGQVVTKRGTSGNNGTSGSRFSGTNGADVIHTLSGNDWIDGKGGNDIICGGAGNDNINGSGGNDALSGGIGADTCNGGSGTDSMDGSCETVNSIP